MKRSKALIKRSKTLNNAHERSGTLESERSNVMERIVENERVTVIKY